MPHVNMGKKTVQFHLVILPLYSRPPVKHPYPTHSLKKEVFNPHSYPVYLANSFASKDEGKHPAVLFQTENNQTMPQMMSSYIWRIFCY